MATPPRDNEHLARLLARTAARDHAAFRELYELTSAHLFGVALRILHRNERAEEVLQDAYVNVWNQAGSYAAGLSAPMTWLSSVVRNKALDRLRHVRLSDQSTVVLVDDEGEEFLDQVAAAPAPTRRNCCCRPPTGCACAIAWARWTHRNARAWRWPTTTGCRTANWPRTCKPRWAP